MTYDGEPLSDIVPNLIMAGVMPFIISTLNLICSLLIEMGRFGPAKVGRRLLHDVAVCGFVVSCWITYVDICEHAIEPFICYRVGDVPRMRYDASVVCWEG